MTDDLPSIPPLNSERDTLLPSELPTATDHAPPEPAEFDIENSDAPDWAKALYRLQAETRAEERARAERLERNQRIQIEEVRRLSRRVGGHDSELEDLRERIEDLEDWRDGVERRGG